MKYTQPPLHGSPDRRVGGGGVGGGRFAARRQHLCPPARPKHAAHRVGGERLGGGAPASRRAPGRRRTARQRGGFPPSPLAATVASPTTAVAAAATGAPSARPAPAADGTNSSEDADSHGLQMPSHLTGRSPIARPSVPPTCRHDNPSIALRPIPLPPAPPFTVMGARSRPPCRVVAG